MAASPLPPTGAAPPPPFLCNTFPWYVLQVYCMPDFEKGVVTRYLLAQYLSHVCSQVGSTTCFPLPAALAPAREAFCNRHSSKCTTGVPGLVLCEPCMWWCRCQESTNRVAIRMHVVEGQHGSVQAFVVPQTCPRVCKAAVHTIKPLCMHHRLNSWEGTVPMNELQITGDNQTLFGSSFPCLPAR